MFSLVEKCNVPFMSEMNRKQKAHIGMYFIAKVYVNINNAMSFNFESQLALT